MARRSRLEEKIIRVLRYIYIFEDVKDAKTIFTYESLETAIRRETDIWLSSQIRDFIKTMIARDYIEQVAPGRYRLTAIGLSLLTNSMNSKREEPEEKDEKNPVVFLSLFSSNLVQIALLYLDLYNIASVSLISIINMPSMPVMNRWEKTKNDRVNWDQAY